MRVVRRQECNVEPPDSLFRRKKVTGALKTQITLAVTLAFTLMSEQEAIREELTCERTINLAAGKTACWAGATPLLTAFSRPKFRGPARHAGSVTVFWPRAGVGECKA